MSDLVTAAHRAGDFIASLVRVVLYHPVRYGTLDLRSHSRGIAGIAWAVAALYGICVISVLFANPLRASFPLESSIDESGNIVVPVFLVPAVLCLLGVSFGLLIAGSQRAPWWRRILYLLAIGGILLSATCICAGLGTSRPLAWACSGLMALVLVYAVVMWLGRTPAALDVFVLVILCSGVLLTCYRSLVGQGMLGQSNGSLVTVSLLLSYVGTLALPVAFLSGISATAFGISVVSWTGEELGQRAALWLGALIAGAVMAWQWFSFVHQAVTEGPNWSERAGELLATLLLLLACAVAWWLVYRSPAVEDFSPMPVTAAAVTVAMPVAYGLAAAAMIGSLLAMIAVGANSLLGADAVKPLFALMDIAGSNAFIMGTRIAVVIGLLIAAVLARRRSPLVAAICAVDTVVFATYFWLGRALFGWLWTPSTIGDVGLVIATVLGLGWTLRRALTHRRVAFLLLLSMLSALVRQADFFAVPVGFLIGASATALLIVGLVWGFLTEGGEMHDDQRGFPADRQLLILLGTFLFGITIVGWAVIGKDVALTLVLSAETVLAVESVGTALIISIVCAFVSYARGRPLLTDSAPEVEAVSGDEGGLSTRADDVAVGDGS